MRTCTEYQARISALLDGELSAAERAEVEAHLAGCDACSAVYEAFAALRLTPEEPPASLHAGIMARVAPARKALRAQRRITRLRTGFAVAASLIVIVGSVLALGRNFFRAGSAAPKAADAPAFQAARVADAAPEANEPSGSAEAPAAAAAGAAAGDGGVLFTEMATADAAEEQAAEKGPAQAEAQNDAEIPYAIPAPAETGAPYATNADIAARAAPTVTLEITGWSGNRFTAVVSSDAAGTFPQGETLTVLVTGETAYDAEGDAASAFPAGALVLVELCEAEADGAVQLVARSIRPADGA